MKKVFLFSVFVFFGFLFFLPGEKASAQTFYWEYPETTVQSFQVVQDITKPGGVTRYRLYDGAGTLRYDSIAGVILNKYYNFSSPILVKYLRLDFYDNIYSLPLYTGINGEGSEIQSIKTYTSTIPGVTLGDVLATPEPTIAPTPTPTATPEPTPSPTPTPALKPTIDVAIAPEKIGLGKEFTADISLKNVKDIYAEDFEVKYDKEHLHYLGFEEVTGYKVYNKPVDQNGAVRFVVASQGEEYGINKDTVVVKLKFKAKAKGTAFVDATKARIADTEEEYDLEKDNCLEDSIIIEATDVNKSGAYTLVDLAIDARYFKYFAPDVDPVKYNAQQAGDEYVNDDDLLFIVDQILNNPDYLPNT